MTAKRIGDMTMDEALDWVLLRVCLVWAAVQLLHWLDL